MTEDQKQKFESFLNQSIEKRQIWLLQADEGQFALLGDDSGRSFMPVWSSQTEAEKAILAEWDDYVVISMGLSEFMGWLDELQGDGIYIGLNPDEDSKILALEASAMKIVLNDKI